jgi:hypothetical protein
MFATDSLQVIGSNLTSALSKPGVVDAVADTMKRVQQAVCESDHLYLGSLTARKGVGWIADGKAQRLVSRADVDIADRKHDIPLSPAVLTMIVRITHEDFWMMSDAQWRPNGVVPFADIKLTTTGGMPEWPALAEDFKTAIGNIRYFMQLAHTAGATEAGVITEQEGVTKVRFRHVPFQVGVCFLCL